MRTDKHKQNIYGPSMTTVETVAKCHIWGRTVSTALGISKAAHEFLVLHYFATDSIVYWNSFIHEVMPLVPLPAPAVRRAEVVEAIAEDPYCTLPPTNAPPHLERCSFPRHGPVARIWKTSIFQHGQGVATGNKGEHKGVLGR